MNRSGTLVKNLLVIAILVMAIIFISRFIQAGWFILLAYSLLVLILGMVFSLTIALWMLEK